MNDKTLSDTLHATTTAARLPDGNRAVTAASTCIKPCAPSPTGCLRCESVPASKSGTGTALLLGPQDADAANTLRAVLGEINVEFQVVGPVFIIHNARPRLAELGKLFKERLSAITQASVVAVHAPGGLVNAEQIMSALMMARPLNAVLGTLEHEWVRDALSDGWLFSVFHPIIDSRTGAAFAQEALMRARDPATGAIIGAGQIINACEKLNLQHQLDQRARQTAIRGAAEHVASTSKVFINFLPNTIYDPAVCLRTTMEAAAQHDVAMDRLVFEVVETERIPDMNHLKKILEYYRERGVGTAIDDMGAGFTSIDYITALKPNFVKLDREFVLSAADSANACAQLQRIVSISHDHGAMVIAEGIETRPQMDLCVNAGVDLLQGFLFAKPACPPAAVSFPTALRRAA